MVQVTHTDWACLKKKEIILLHFCLPYILFPSCSLSGSNSARPLLCRTVKQLTLSALLAPSCVEREHGPTHARTVSILIWLGSLFLPLLFFSFFLSSWLQVLVMKFVTVIVLVFFFQLKSLWLCNGASFSEHDCFENASWLVAKWNVFHAEMRVGSFECLWGVVGGADV